MSLFRDMYSMRVIHSLYDLHELERMLGQAIERGFAQEIFVSRNPISGQVVSNRLERWFADVESGDIYSLQYGDGERGYWGQWDAIQSEEFLNGSMGIQ